MAALVLFTCAESFAASGIIFIQPPLVVTINGVRKLQTTVFWLMNDPNFTDGVFIDLRDFGQTASTAITHGSSSPPKPRSKPPSPEPVPNDFVIQGDMQ